MIYLYVSNYIKGKIMCMSKFFKRKSLVIDGRLSPHFSYNEMTRSQTAIRNNINNTPNRVELKCLKELCINALEPIRVYYSAPVNVTSGFRSVLLNRKIGSIDSSQHVLGQAADFIVNRQNNLDVWKWIILESGIKFDQIIAEFFDLGGWIHLSYVKKNPRFKCSIAKKVDGKTRYFHYEVDQIMNEEYIL